MVPKNISALAERIMILGQLASILEVSGWPKPGNVHRTRDLPDVRYEHFLAGSVALGPSIRKAALKGIMVGLSRISNDRIGIGSLIKEAVLEIKSLHKGGNTHLGTCFLNIPLASSAGKTVIEIGEFKPSRLSKNVVEINRSTTSLDAVRVYEAIKLIGTKRTLGKVKSEDALDLYERNVEEKVKMKGLTLYEAMKVASKWDRIASEFVNGMEVTFKIGYPAIKKTFEDTRDINVATVHCFLEILSRVPDTLIARKVGLKEKEDVRKAVEVGIERTRWISEAAKEILEKGGLKTKEGRGALIQLDMKLHESKGLLNPGTTADLTASSLMVALLCGLNY